MDIERVVQVREDGFPRNRMLKRYYTTILAGKCCFHEQEFAQKFVGPSVK